MTRHNLRRSEVERLLESDRPTKRNPLLQEQWVRTLASICTALRTDRADPAGLFVSVFWIRLYGAITELLSRFQKSALLADGADPAMPFYRYHMACVEVFNACEAIRDTLDDDELVYAAFTRQVHAHVFQDGFEYTIERGNRAHGQPGSVRSKQMVRPLGRHIPIDEVHAIVDRVHQMHGSDHAIAVAFARKLAPAIDRLALSIAELDRARDAVG